jgi:hypothetical protein
VKWFTLELRDRSEQNPSLDVDVERVALRAAAERVQLKRLEPMPPRGTGNGRSGDRRPSGLLSVAHDPEAQQAQQWSRVEHDRELLTDALPTSGSSWLLEAPLRSSQCHQTSLTRTP